MREIEARFRAVPRAVRMDVKTTRDERRPGVRSAEPDSIRVWGVFSGGAAATDILYVFTEPRWMRGTGLMLQDPWDPQAEDAMWYHMTTFRRFLHVPRASLKVRVTGTCLTYEDARGFLSSDKYEFRYRAAATDVPASERVIIATPRTPELANDTGYSSLEVTVNRERRQVTRVAYTGLAGRLIKTYTLIEPVRLGDLWLGRTARVEDHESSMVSLVASEYWSLTPPPPELYGPSVEEESLLDRLAGFLAAQGVDVELPEQAEGTAAEGLGRSGSPLARRTMYAAVPPFWK
jgi:hypothetical protein